MIMMLNMLGDIANITKIGVCSMREGFWRMVGLQWQRGGAGVLTFQMPMTEEPSLNRWILSIIDTNKFKATLTFAFNLSLFSQSDIYIYIIPV